MAWKKSIFREFEKYSHEVAAYHRAKVFPPPHIQVYYAQALADLREHLDSHGMKMPKPYYFYDPENRQTHRYIRSSTGKGCMLNPEYLYRDVWKLRP